MEESYIFCPNCGYNVPMRVYFCSNCGFQLREKPKKKGEKTVKPLKKDKKTSEENGNKEEDEEVIFFDDWSDFSPEELDEWT